MSPAVQILMGKGLFDRAGKRRKAAERREKTKRTTRAKECGLRRAVCAEKVRARLKGDGTAGSVHKSGRTGGVRYRELKAKQERDKAAHVAVSEQLRQQVVDSDIAVAPKCATQKAEHAEATPAQGGNIFGTKGEGERDGGGRVDLIRRRITSKASLAMLVEQPKCLATAPSSHGMDGCKQLGSAQCSNEVLHHCPAIVIADVDYARAPSSHGMDRCMQLDEPQCADEVPHRCQAIAIEDVDCKARTARESAIFERWERDRLSWEDRLSRTENKACRDVAHRRSVVIMRAANLLKCW
jgi:hypothetical protein